MQVPFIQGSLLCRFGGLFLQNEDGLMSLFCRHLNKVNKEEA